MAKLESHHLFFYLHVITFGKLKAFRRRFAHSLRTHRFHLHCRHRWSYLLLKSGKKGKAKPTQASLQSKRREGAAERILLYRGESTESGVNTVSSRFYVFHSMLALLVSFIWDIIVLSASKLLNLTHRFSCMLDLVAIVPRIN